ncbi:hypothetical protein BH24ACI4_BH24ACI4_09470 [soil metagenome]
MFQKRSESWRVIAEDIRPAVTPVPEPGTRPTTQPAALPPRGIEDTEVRRAVEAWRVATDPEAQRSFGRVQDSRAILDGLAEEYVRVRRDPNLTLETKDTHRAQFDEVDRTGKAVAPGHQWANAPNASLRFENVNVAVFGTVAVVTWRTIVNGSDRAPAYSVFGCIRSPATHGAASSAFDRPNRTAIPQSRCQAPEPLGRARRHHGVTGASWGEDNAMVLPHRHRERARGASGRSRTDGQTPVAGVRLAEGAAARRW